MKSKQLTSHPIAFFINLNRWVNGYSSRNSSKAANDSAREGASPYDSTFEPMCENLQEAIEQVPTLRGYLTLYSKRQELGRTSLFAITTHDLKKF